MKRSLFKRYEIVFVVVCILLLQICCQEQLEEANASKSAATEPKPALANSEPAVVEAKPQNPATTAAQLPEKQEPANAETSTKVNKSVWVSY